MENCDVLVIGAGIVGLASALRLLENNPSLNLIVVDKERGTARHQTGHNSGVIHCGIYYKPGSLKAKLCRQGVSDMLAFAKEHQIKYELCGKVIVATQEAELPRLEKLYEYGVANGVPALDKIDPMELKRLEPHANGLAAIHSPTTGIINYKQVADAMAKQIKKLGGKIFFDNKVIHAETKGDTTIVSTPEKQFSAKLVLNCAGLYSDAMVNVFGHQSKSRIIPFRGEYYLLNNKNLVRNLIYPVPDPELPFLGVHFTRTIDDILEAGPNAVLAFAKEGYRYSNINLSELSQTLTFKGFVPMAAQFWKTGLMEFYRSASKKAFTKALQRLVPDVRMSDLDAGPSGVRAQCVDENGNLVSDFLIEESGNCIHVLNVPSPAATASLAIGTYIAQIAERRFKAVVPA